MFDDTMPWLVALTALLLWLPQNAAHEGAHCLAHKLAGDEIVGFWPFPSRTADGFSFAHMSYRRTAPVAPWLDGLSSCAPQLANTLVLLLLVPLHWLALPAWASSILVGWAVVNLVDGTVNLGTLYRPEPKPTTDGWRTLAAWGLNPWVGRVFVGGWHVGMFLHVAALT